ncbi:MAG: ABC transporter permease [Actinomycetota bacterium]
MSLRLVPRVRPWRTGALILPLLAILVTLMLSSGVVLATGVNPLSVFAEIFIEPLRSNYSFLESLVSATPLLLTGTAVTIAFRSGYYNIGAEGQLLAGAICAAGIGPHLGSWPAPIGIMVMIAAGVVGGVGWALIPALLRTKFNIDEVVTTLLLNPTATLLVNGLLNGPWRNPETGFNESPRIVIAAEFPEIVDRSRLNFGFIVAVVVALLAGLVMHRSVLGIKLRAVGLSRDGARFAGLPVERLLMRAALASGGVAGIAGACLVSGIQYRLTEGISGGFGYTGIIVSTLGGIHIAGAACAALLLAIVNVGSSSANRVFGIPAQLGDVIAGTLLMVTVALLLFRKYRIVVSRKS